MAMTKCGECGASISTKASKCPQCGAARSTTMSKLRWIVILPVLAVVGYCSWNMGTVMNTVDETRQSTR
jgi:hypothetical protein